jgi:hypothetical protein
LSYKSLRSNQSRAQKGTFRPLLRPSCRSITSSASP